MITAIIVDDEEAGVENLNNLIIKYCPGINVVGTAGSANEAKIIIDKHAPQLVFLDIEMPFGNAFNLLAEYEKVPFEVIFVTAFEKYALQAIRLSACDYILKPIDVSILANAVNKATERINAKTENVQLKNLLTNIKSLDKERKIALPAMQGMIFVKITDIVHCRADGGYTWFKLTNQNEMLATKNLGEYETLLADSGFIRVHHASLINKLHVVEYKKGNSPVLVMSDGSNINVSQRKRDLLMEQLLNA